MKHFTSKSSILMMIYTSIILIGAGTFSYGKTHDRQTANNLSGNNKSAQTLIETAVLPPTENITNNTAPSPAENKAATSHIPILMYHHIKTNNDPGNSIEQGLDLPPDQFELQIKSLADHGYKSITTSYLFTTQQDNKIALTFDDGYKDIILNAFPIMQKYHFVGTAYIITYFVGGGDYMSWDDIKILKNAGWDIGSHTLNHPDLSKIPLSKARQEIFESKTKIESEMGAPITAFCYPSGKYKAAVVNLVKEAGYTDATTTHNGRNNSLDKILELNRLRINGPDSISQFEKKVY